jgi:hypothetical protein
MQPIDADFCSDLRDRSAPETPPGETRIDIEINMRIKSRRKEKDEIGYPA